MAGGTLVSVIMPVHNSAATLSQAVRSVQGQSHENWELLITDDGSADGSWDLIRGFADADPRIKPQRADEPSGAAHARNLAIERAAGSWVAFLDSDDLWLPHKLGTQLEFAAHTAAPLTFSSYYKVESDFDVEASQYEPTDRIIAARESVDYQAMLEANYIGCLTAMYDRDRLGTRFMPEIRKRQDYALWLSILRDGLTARGLSEPLALYRQARPGSLSGSKWSLVRYNWELYRDIEKLSLPQSLRSLATAVLRSVRNSRV